MGEFIIDKSPHDMGLEMFVTLMATVTAMTPRDQAAVLVGVANAILDRNKGGMGLIEGQESQFVVAFARGGRRAGVLSRKFREAKKEIEQ